MIYLGSSFTEEDHATMTLIDVVIFNFDLLIFNFDLELLNLGYQVCYSQMINLHCENSPLQKHVIYRTMKGNLVCIPKKCKIYHAHLFYHYISGYNNNNNNNKVNVCFTVERQHRRRLSEREKRSKIQVGKEEEEERLSGKEQSFKRGSETGEAGWGSRARGYEYISKYICLWKYYFQNFYILSQVYLSVFEYWQKHHKNITYPINVPLKWFWFKIFTLVSSLRFL